MIQQPTPGHILRQNYNSKRYLHPCFIAAVFTIAKTWKQSKCPSTDEWINKMWYIDTIEYYSAIKKEFFKVLYYKIKNVFFIFCVCFLCIICVKSIINLLQYNPI